MTPSPFAERLIDDVRPILRSIQRVLVPPQPFDPRTSTRTFRIAISDIAPSLFPRLMTRIRREAPSVVMDWAAEGPHTLLAVAEGQVDVAFVASALALPEGIGRQEAGDIQWATFARHDHPAIASWGAAAWGRWPHVLVQVGNSLQSPVVSAAGERSAQAADRCARPELLRRAAIARAHGPSRHAAGDRDARGARAIRTRCAAAAISGKSDAAPLRVEPAFEQRSGGSMDSSESSPVVSEKCFRTARREFCLAFRRSLGASDASAPIDKPTIHARSLRVSFRRSRH